MAGPYAFVTLVSSDSYLPGALAQAAALRDLHPQPPASPEVPFQSICLVTPETVDVSTIKFLHQSFDLVVGVEVLEAHDLTNLHLLGRPDLTTVFTKLHVFRLTEYSKIIFLDADVLPVRPLSHLFNLPHDFAAAPDVGWPDIFNSGVLVLSPGHDKFNDLTDLLKSKGSWDGGDQGLLNEWRGGNWHRLSFTYNTTPTAAYTYAPAYERFGSQINALHFIGPNKPWHSIPFRSPFLAENRPTSLPRTSQQAYDYESLVDRWFAVYDKHYRSRPILPPSFEVKHYPSIWDLSPSSTRPAEGKLLDLEDLRRLAIEGINATGSFTRKDGQGEYRSLPLEGRFDLMRPKKPSAETQKDESSITGPVSPPESSSLETDFMDTENDLPMTPMAHYIGLPDGPRYLHAPPATGVPVPPDLGTVPQSLLETSEPMSDYYASSAGPTSGSDSGSIANNSSGLPIKASHLFAQASRARHSSHSNSDVEVLIQHSTTHAVHHRHHHEHAKPFHVHHIQHQNGFSKSQDKQDSTLRPLSPPLVSWNPAVEPPPNNPPPPSAFPIDPYFSNVWDSARNSGLGHSQNSSGHRSDFFEAPPPPQIPETLRAEGHYRNVTGDTVADSNSVPDLKKVKPVFPWEDKPRQRPERVFPDSDTPSPGRFTNPKSVKPPPSPGRSLKQPSPQPRLSAKLKYSNAWDVNPSIQSYAKRLVQPSATTTPSGWQDWYEKSEASSQDGDDEDNADEDADADEPDSDDDGKTRRRSRSSSSVAEDTRQVQKSAQKRYRSRGVQTVPVKTQSQGVQVVEGRNHRVLQPSRNSTTANTSSTKQSTQTWHSHTTSGAPPAPVLPRARSVSSGSLGISPSGVATPRIRRDFIAPSGSISPYKPPTRAAPQVSSRSVSTSPVRPFILITQESPAVSIKQRQISIDSSVCSPASSVGPVSPTDDQLYAHPIRKGTRVWDPARGVESFKRGSEEVLARFLKMGSFETR